MLNQPTKRSAAVLGAVVLAATLSACPSSGELTVNPGAPQQPAQPAGAVDFTAVFVTQPSATGSPCASTIQWTFKPVAMTGSVGKDTDQVSTERYNQQPVDGNCLFEWKVAGVRIGEWELDNDLHGPCRVKVDSPYTKTTMHGGVGGVQCSDYYGYE